MLVLLTEFKNEKEKLTYQIWEWQYLILSCCDNCRLYFNDIFILDVYLIMCLIINGILANFQLSDIVHHIPSRAEETQNLTERGRQHIPPRGADIIFLHA